MHNIPLPTPPLLSPTLRSRSPLDTGAVAKDVLLTTGVASFNDSMKSNGEVLGNLPAGLKGGWRWPRRPLLCHSVDPPKQKKGVKGSPEDEGEEVMADLFDWVGLVTNRLTDLLPSPLSPPTPSTLIDRPLCSSLPLLPFLL